MILFKLSKSDQKFLFKVLISAILLLTIFFSLLYINNKSEDISHKKYDSVNNTISASKIPLYYTMKCIGGIASADSCNGNFFKPLVEILDDKNIHQTKGGIYIQHEIDFVIHYYAGYNSFCKDKACDKQTYYMEMYIEDGTILEEYNISKYYHLHHGRNDESIDTQIEKIEEIEILNFPEVTNFLKYLEKLSQKKQKALVK